MPCMAKYITQTHLGEIYEDVFYICAIWDTGIFIEELLRFWQKNPTVLMFVDITGAPKL